MSAVDGDASNIGGNTVTVHRLSVGGPRFSVEMQEQVKQPSGLIQLKDYEITYRSCIAIFVVVLLGVSMIPLKEYYLGSYVTKPFDEVRDEVAARKLNQMGVVMSGVHYFDTFERSLIPLIDLETKKELTRSTAANISLTDFLVRANLRRDDLLAGLPEELLATSVDLMVDVLAPLCGPVTSTLTSWETPAQLLFGNWFPAIRHEFCRDFHDRFPLDRYFNHAVTAPTDANLSDVGDVTLGLIAVVNMSELYLRHFNDALVIRKIMKNVQEGYMGLDLPDYTNDVAQAIVDRYSNGIPLADVVAMLPGSYDIHHVALVDVLGVSALLAYYLETQELTMGVNVNGEAAILAEVTHAAASFFTSDFLIDTVGMHLASTMHLAPFWNCAIKYTTMDKAITVDDVDAAAIKQCGQDLSVIVPTFAVNLMFLFQKDERDYTKLDNTTVYTLGRRRETTAGYVPLTLPETLTESPILALDGTAWTKSRSNTTGTQPATTPYGYLYTPDCRGTVDDVMKQSGRNVQKYQAYMGDGLGNCAFRDSQETDLQTLCRLFMTTNEVLFRDLNGNLIELPSCASLIASGASAEEQLAQQNNLRQIEWFMIDTTLINRRIRIQDNTSRQIRTFLLILNLIGASYYAMEYIYILKSVWIFIRNSVYRPVKEMQSRLGTLDSFDNKATALVRIGLFELLQCDPADGALEHPGTMVLLYLGAIGAFSNIFSLSCTAQLSTAAGSIVIYCTPTIPLLGDPGDTSDALASNVSRPRCSQRLHSILDAQCFGGPGNPLQLQSRGGFTSPQRGAPLGSALVRDFRRPGSGADYLDRIRAAALGVYGLKRAEESGEEALEQNLVEGSFHQGVERPRVRGQMEHPRPRLGAVSLCNAPNRATTRAVRHPAAKRVGAGKEAQEVRRRPAQRYQNASVRRRPLCSRFPRSLENGQMVFGAERNGGSHERESSAESDNNSSGGVCDRGDRGHRA
ncbi:hypothetical protein ON010_g10383 [Phytophthora cinnamomi]|nr:hypothetical protein ON010_g10383 [Phytophthora cinnamomi]